MLPQIAAITAVNVRSIAQRLGSSAVAVCGIVGVVVVVAAVLLDCRGAAGGVQDAGDPDTVLVLRGQRHGDDERLLSPARARDRGSAGDRAGRRAARVAELLVIAGQPLRRSGVDANVPLRGVLPVAFKVHKRLRIIAGRNFTPGSNEVIVGRAALQQFAGLDVGSTLRWGPNTWRVAGIFEDHHSISEGEIWCDARVAQPAYRRNNSYQSVVVRLASRDRFGALKDALTTDPRLTVVVMHQSDYYAQQSQDLERVIWSIGVVLGGLMGLGAVFAATNTMYTAVASRTREIATLRALGFGAVPVVVSVLAEAVFLSLVSGVIGGAIAWAAFDGFRTSTMNLQSYSQVSFDFAVTPRLLGQSLSYAIVLGLLGGALPAVRATRLPVVVALREP